MLKLLGCFIAGLEYSADVRAEVIGKPEEAFFNAALRQLNSITPSSETQIPIEKEGKSFTEYLYIDKIVALNSHTQVIN